MIPWSAANFVEANDRSASLGKRHVVNPGEHGASFNSCVGVRIKSDGKATFNIGGELKQLDHLARRYDLDRANSGWAVGVSTAPVDNARVGHRHGGVRRINTAQRSRVAIAPANSGALAAVTTGPMGVRAASTLGHGATKRGDLPQQRSQGVARSVSPQPPTAGIARQPVHLKSTIDLQRSSLDAVAPLSPTRRRSQPFSRTVYVSHSLDTLLKEQRGSGSVISGEYAPVFLGVGGGTLPSSARTRRRQYDDQYDLTETNYKTSAKPRSPRRPQSDITSSVEKLRAALPSSDKAAALVLRRAFRKFDIDRRGSVSQAEFRRGLNRLGVQLERGDIESLLEVVEGTNRTALDYDYGVFADAVVRSARSSGTEKQAAEHRRAPPRSPMRSQRARGAHHPVPRFASKTATAAAKAANASQKWAEFRANWTNKHGKTSAVHGDFAAVAPFRVVHARERAAPARRGA